MSTVLRCETKSWTHVLQNRGSNYWLLRTSGFHESHHDTEHVSYYYYYYYYYYHHHHHLNHHHQHHLQVIRRAAIIFTRYSKDSSSVISLFLEQTIS